jgi:hypothetical protein
MFLYKIAIQILGYCKYKELLQEIQGQSLNLCHAGVSSSLACQIRKDAFILAQNLK